MQSEGGAAGAVHGALTGGALTTTFTASQGLLLMIPNMYKIAGELQPCVFHVAARAIAGQALSIYGEHSDVMACRSTGFAMLNSQSVQEAHDIAIAAHIATLESRVPFVHFFDGFRTSHEIQKVKLVDYQDLAKYIPTDKVAEFRNRGVNPEHPELRGTAQTPDVFFQISEAANKFYDKVPEIVDQTFAKIEKLVGRRYHLFEYEGAADATSVVVVMGSGCEVCVETSRYLNKEHGQKTGVLKVRLYRPWSISHFLNALPKTVERIAVLDRMKDPASHGEPLYLDVCAAFESGECKIHPKVLIGGRYGLGSKDFTPGMVWSVFNNLAAKEPIKRFTVGIEDDVTHLSLPFVPEPNTLPSTVKQCLFWGLGSDGTVGANKDAIKIIGDHTDMTIQAYFYYDARKSGGLTQSHLRFGKEPITSPYLIQKADYVACHKTYYVNKFEVLGQIKEGGVFVLNSPWSTLEEMEKNLCTHTKRLIGQKKVRFYNVDAFKLGQEIGLGKRINMILQTAFFKLTEVIPFEKAVEYLKAAIKKTYGKKGDAVVNMNYKAVDGALAELKEIKYPASWANLPNEPKPINENLEPGELPEFIEKVMIPMSNFDGDTLPVSVFTPGGYFPSGTTKYEKRGIALEIPEWDASKCTQCNQCAMVCPHAVIRPFVLSPEEAKAAPASFETVKSTAGPAGLKYRIQVSPFDCTGCALCSTACPDNALTMKPAEEEEVKQKHNWEYAMKVAEKGQLFDRNTVKGAQFSTPLLEFSGACEGCGETPYVKLLTQLFGERMVIANATGCSSIWGGTAGFNPYTTNQKGQGPAWANSLFEDNAEYGLGMHIAAVHRREKHESYVQQIVNNPDVKISADLKNALADWLAEKDNGAVCQKISEKIKTLLEVEHKNDPMLEQIYQTRDQFPKISQWIVGGDGWAYDIGYGGVDHVMASGHNINVLIMDTEMYSNTGGQASKATSLGAVQQFTANGKRINKKEMAQMFMSYGNVYVASVCMYANMNQVVKAFNEAESYDGPSVIFAYAPCMQFGLRPGMSASFKEAQQAVNTGYWPLYRWDPRLVDQHKNPFQLDCKKIHEGLKDFLAKEVRFSSLMLSKPDVAKKLQSDLEDHLKTRFQSLQQKALGYSASAPGAGAPTGSGPKMLVLYGSDTGTTEQLANNFYEECKQRGVNVTLSSCDDYETEELVNEPLIVLLVSTCGQGELPPNCRNFYKYLQGLSPDTLKNTKYAVFGLGDSNYTFFNQAAKKYDEVLAKAGAKRVVETGYGNDQDEDKFNTAYDIWEPNLFNALDIKPAQLQGPPQPKNIVEIKEGAHAPGSVNRPASSVVKMISNVRMTPKDYDRDIMHLQFDIRGSGVQFNVGDSLAIYARNIPENVDRMLKHFGLSGNEVLSIKAVDPKNAGVFPSLISTRQLFTERLDLFGKPNKRFYEQLSIFGNEADKKALLHLTSNEGKADFDNLVKETVTYADIFEKYASCKVPIANLLDLVPQIKPRYYSIASSMAMYPDTLHLCVVVVDWKTPSGKERFGLCTDYLRHCTPTKDAPINVECTVKAGTIVLPESTETPVVMAGLGTGIAPFRAFVQQRAMDKKAGKKIGPMLLYYGCRYQKTEYLFSDEWDQYHKDDVLEYMRPAFSRDQAKKVYIQNKVDDEPALPFDLLHTKKGHFYFCGPASRVPEDVKQSIIRAFVSQGKMTEEQAKKEIETMEATGRYTLEAW